MTALLTPLIQPLNLFMTALVAAVVLRMLRWRRAGRLTLVVGAVWLLAWSLPITSLWLGSALEQRYAYFDAADSPTADAIVVLGGHTANNRTNWFLAFDAETARSRVGHAADLYLAERAPRVVLSGGTQDGRISEARNMARLLRREGVPDTAMLLENGSRTTYENALFTRQTLQEHGIERVLLVTSALHMPRAMATFRQQTDAIVIAAPVAPQIRIADESRLNIWLPNRRTLDASRSIIKEYAGLLVYWLRGWI